jgi:hypothetical protein
MYTITLADGTELKNLELNGNNYISETIIDNSVFNDNLSTVNIFDGETDTTYTNMVLVQNTTYDGITSWFILRERTEQEKNDELIQNKIDSAFGAIRELTALLNGVNL